jgi:acyl carrier protein
MTGGAAAAELERQLRDFIVSELLEEAFHGQDPLAEGTVDSLGVEQLIEHVHETYGVELADEDVVYENFESLAALAALVDSKTGARP